MYEKVYGLHMCLRIYQLECIFLLNERHHVLDKIVIGDRDNTIKAYYQLREKIIDELGEDEWWRRNDILQDIRSKGFKMEIFDDC